MIESRHLLGVRIKELRKEQRLTQRQLSLMIGMDRSYVSRIERGKSNVSFEVILILASALDISPSQLLDGIGRPIDQGMLPITLTASRYPNAGYATFHLQPAVKRKPRP